MRGREPWEAHKRAIARLCSPVTDLLAPKKDPERKYDRASGRSVKEQVPKLTREERIDRDIECSITNLRRKAMPNASVDPSIIIQILKELAGFIHAQVSDPVKDKERILRLDRAHDLAKTGDTSVYPEFGTTYAGQPLNGEQYIDYIIDDVPALPPEHGTSSGSKIARAYARLVKLRLQTGV